MHEIILTIGGALDRLSAQKEPLGIFMRPVSAAATVANK
jgi:hypothetical protein